MSVNLSTAQAYIMARHHRESALECKEREHVRAADPDKVLQDLPRDEIPSRILYKHEDREDVSAL